MYVTLNTINDLVMSWVWTSSHCICSKACFHKLNSLQHDSMSWYMVGLTPNVLYGHDMVMNSSLWPLWHQFGWFLDWFNYSSCSCSSLLCHATWRVLIQQSCFLINSNMEVCSQPVYTGTSPWTHAWHLSPLRFKGSISWTLFFCWSYVPMISNWFEKLDNTQTQHILNIHYWNF